MMTHSSPRATTGGLVKKIHAVSIYLYSRFAKLFNWIPAFAGMTAWIIVILLTTMSSPTLAEDSPFDVLNADDRYKSTEAKEFDVNEGEEETTATAPAQQAHDPFEALQNAPQVTIDLAGTYYNVAKIVALNKITAKSKEFSIKVGDTAYFGNIAISVKKCWGNNDPYFPQNKILLSVVESRVDDDPQNVFSGWMISSNMQASAMEHPSYEVIAIDCNNGK